MVSKFPEQLQNSKSSGVSSCQCVSGSRKMRETIFELARHCSFSFQILHMAYLSFICKQFHHPPSPRAFLALKNSSLPPHLFIFFYFFSSQNTPEELLLRYLTSNKLHVSLTLYVNNSCTMLNTYRLKGVALGCGVFS